MAKSYNVIQGEVEYCYLKEANFNIEVAQIDSELIIGQNRIIASGRFELKDTNKNLIDIVTEYYTKEYESAPTLDDLISFTTEFKEFVEEVKNKYSGFVL